MRLYVWAGDCWVPIIAANESNMGYWRGYYRNNRTEPMCTCVVKDVPSKSYSDDHTG